MNGDKSSSIVGSILVSGAVVVSIVGLSVVWFLDRTAKVEEEQIEEEKKIPGFRFKHYNKQKKFTIATEIQPVDEKGNYVWKQTVRNKVSGTNKYKEVQFHCDSVERDDILKALENEKEIRRVKRLADKQLCEVFNNE